MNKITLLSVLIILNLSSCKSEDKDKKEEMPVYPITQPLKMDTNISKDFVAQIQSQKNIEVRAQGKGFLDKIYVDEGQYVKAGQVLFRIMPQVYEAEFMKTRAEVEQARIEYQNASILAGNNIVSKNEKALAKAKLDAASAEMRMAQLHLSFTTIRAPFSGVINRIPLKLGSLIEEGDLLTSLSDNTNVYAYFNVSEPEYLSYQTNADERSKQQVTLVMANGQEHPEKGFIQNIEGEFNNETGNIAFRAKFPNSDLLLRNGQTGKVRMEIPVKNALIIPQKATYEIQDQKYVFVVDKNGKVESRNIKVIYSLPDIYVVSSGLSVGDKILLEGVQKVRDNDVVKTQFQNPKEVLKTLKLNAN
ncbi:efflux RND transporter periplasmic adaptor subunit [Riemerella anatipestifer]|uniref:Efflux RND transporter periplasmic adaptor subunit n=1 Tax=Riemerella anatipestifer TaxID=34085 RepID=A0AAP6LLF7_RIEAN|nr:efflux RND transporter periplasmic adaptor subunit [Riemerella anatipestifer]MCD5969229.1 efflux RND transporter periplasmic adaptor subunit [Riemerella anatipestifer]MCO7354610.1 efflux RND transporter periplasmic adaptor subunit [Riemerella anatipestifer]MCU7539898.1 efflux RND transporter periplasmic adaptor subunit [Riemerella anatipestifer]MCU7569922.1 efflux RND transporter periplasmic adaptor subunit [Riemerella anatipestifer]MCU7597194.1 efflux RND transporter periplasmic adaptor su